MLKYNDVILQNDNELRKKNIECIRKFVDAKTYEQRSERLKCFVEDCTIGAEGFFIINGIGKAEKFIEWGLKYFPNYIFNDNIIFQSQDPNFYIVSSKGCGGIYYPAYGKQKPYENIYFQEIYMRDGKIKDYYAFYDTRKIYEALGFTLPEIESPGGWAEADEDEINADPYKYPNYSMPNTPDVISDNDNDLRQKNIDNMRKYYIETKTQEERSERWRIFTDDCTNGAAGLPVTKGIKKAEMCTKWNIIHFADNAFINNVYLHSQDPNLFLVTSDSTAIMNYPAYGEPKSYTNRFYHMIRMRDGKMQDYYEFTNGEAMYLTLGIELPELEIPAGLPEPDENFKYLWEHRKNRKNN